MEAVVYLLEAVGWSESWKKEGELHQPSEGHWCHF